MPRQSRHKLPILLSPNAKAEAKRAQAAERQRKQRLRKANAAAGEANLPPQVEPAGRAEQEEQQPAVLGSLLTPASPREANTPEQDDNLGDIEDDWQLAGTGSDYSFSEADSEAEFYPAEPAGAAQSLISPPETQLETHPRSVRATSISSDSANTVSSDSSLPLQVPRAVSDHPSPVVPVLAPFLGTPEELQLPAAAEDRGEPPAGENGVVIPPDDEDGFFGGGSDVELEADEEDGPALQGNLNFTEEQLAERRDKLVQWLTPLLLGRFPSCKAEDHAETLAEHPEAMQACAAASRDHLRLADMRLEPELVEIPRGNNGRVLPTANISVDVWEKTFVGYRKHPAERPPPEVANADDSDAEPLEEDAEQLPPEQQTAAEKAAARAAIAAADRHIENGAKRSPQVCLQCSQPRGDSGAWTTYDVDSVLGYTSSLAFAKKGIRFAGVPTAMATFKKSLHLYRDVSWVDENQRSHRRRVALHLIPHFCFGTVMGSTHMTVYIFFPGLFQGADKAKFAMTKADKKEWYDKVFYPALYADSGASADLLQHYPASFDAADRAAHARSKETARLTNQTRSENISHVLTAQYLAPLWQGMSARIAASPGLCRFADAFIFFSDKNLKLEYKQPSLGTAWRLFKEKTETYLDFDYIRKADIMVDVACEVIADSAEPFVCLWRRCCMENILRECCAASQGSLKRGQIGAKAKTAHYTHCLLDGVQSGTFEPAMSSLPRVLGLSYGQFYHSVKEIYDANKTMPLAYDWLESLSLDPHLYKTMMAERSNLEKLEGVWRAYQATIDRLRGGLRGSTAKHFGGRSEIRLSWELMEACEARRVLIGRESPGEERADPLWKIPTGDYLNFVLYNVGKFSTLFEYLAAPRKDVYVTWERSQMMVMLLRSLRACFNDVPLERDWTLWWHRRNFTPKGKQREDNPEDDVDNEEGDDFIEAPSQTTQGLALCLTISGGYGWCGDKIDWDRLVFTQPYRQNIAFGNRSMFRAIRFYNSRGLATVRKEMTEVRRLLQILKRSYRVLACRELLLAKLVEICIVSFRQYVVTALGRAIGVEAIQGNKDGLYRLDGHFIASLGGGVTVQNSTNNMNMRSVRDLFNLQWGIGDESRRGWRAAPFRNYAGMIRSFLQTNLRREAVGLFDKELYDTVRLTCWVLPHSNKNALIQTGKMGQGGLYVGKKLFLASTNRVLQHYERRIEVNNEQNPSEKAVTWRELMHVLELEDRYPGTENFSWTLANENTQVLRLRGPSRNPLLELYDTVEAIRQQCREWMSRQGEGAIPYSQQLAGQPLVGDFPRAVVDLRTTIAVEKAVERAALGKKLRTEKGKEAQESLELQQLVHAREVQRKRWQYLGGTLSFGKEPVRGFWPSSEGALEIEDWYDGQTKYFERHIDGAPCPTRAEVERLFGCTIEELRFELADRIRQYARNAGWDVLNGDYPTARYEPWQGLVSAQERRRRLAEDEAAAEAAMAVEEDEWGGSLGQGLAAVSWPGASSVASSSTAAQPPAGDPPATATEPPRRPFNPTPAQKARARVNENRRVFLSKQLARGLPWPLLSREERWLGSRFEQAEYPTKREVLQLFGRAPKRLKYTPAIELEQVMVEARWDFIDGVYD